MFRVRVCLAHQYVIYNRITTKFQGDTGLEAQRAYVEHAYKNKPVTNEFNALQSGKYASDRPE